MSTTSLTLIDALVTPTNPSEYGNAWHRFAALYTPLLLAWARTQGLQDADAADFVQEVLLRLLRALPDYPRGEGHRFRGWLLTLVRNLYLDFRELRRNRQLPGAVGLSGLADAPPPDIVAEMDEREYRLRLTRQAMEVIRGDFTGPTWAAFHGLAIEGWPVAEVATKLGLSRDAVHAAHARVTKRLRDELAGFLN